MKHLRTLALAIILCTALLVPGTARANGTAGCRSA